MPCNKILLLAMSLTLVSGQRPSFAGTRPIGFPEIIKPTTEALGNRFGEDDVSTTTIRLPVEANGDRDLIDRLSKLPVDQQPFWYLNWQAYEAHRQNPQTYPQRPNVFVDPSSSNQQVSNQQSSTSFSQSPTNINPMNQPSNNRPPSSSNQGQIGISRPPPSVNQGQINFNRPPPNFNQGQMNPNQPSTNSNQASNGLGNRFSDTDLVNPVSSNSVQSTTKSPTLQELYFSQQIKPVQNADGTTSWQIVDKTIVDALEKIQNKESGRT